MDRLVHRFQRAFGGRFGKIKAPEVDELVTFGPFDFGYTQAVRAVLPPICPQHV